MSREWRHLVSIAMPVYNCGPTLAMAIRSILHQTFEDWELLLLDDGSSDRTLEVARSFPDPRILVFDDHSHQGLVSRLNQAIDVSRGKYFARMDGDDVSYPERLALQVEHLQHHPDIDLLGGGILVFGRGGKVLGKREKRITHMHICRKPRAGFYLAHPTWMGKMEWFRKYRYRADAVRCEDHDLLLRAHESSLFAALPEIILGYREEELSLKKILTGRRHLVQSAVCEGSQKRHYAVAIAVLVEQALKGFVDCVAVGTGLNYRILRHRALPVGEAEKERWTKVWNGAHQEAIESLV